MKRTILIINSLILTFALLISFGIIISEMAQPAQTPAEESTAPETTLSADTVSSPETTLPADTVSPPDTTFPETAPKSDIVDMVPYADLGFGEICLGDYMLRNPQHDGPESHDYIAGCIDLGGVVELIHLYIGEDHMIFAVKDGKKCGSFCCNWRDLNILYSDCRFDQFIGRVENGAYKYIMNKLVFSGGSLGAIELWRIEYKLEGEIWTERYFLSGREVAREELEASPEYTAEKTDTAEKTVTITWKPHEGGFAWGS